MASLAAAGSRPLVSYASFACGKSCSCAMAKNTGLCRFPLPVSTGQPRRSASPFSVFLHSRRDSNTVPAAAATADGGEAAATTPAQWLHLFAVLAVLLAADASLKTLFAQLAWSFPPALGGMFAIMAGLAMVDATAGQSGLDTVYAAAAPGLDWLGRWLPLFFVPVMITISLSLRGLAGAELATFGAVVVGGMVASLFATGCAAKAIRSIAKTDLQETPKAAAAAPFHRSHYVAWAAIAAVALPLGVVAPEYARISGVVFTLATTVFGFVAASGLPAAVRTVLHPIIVCGAVGFSGVAAWASLMGFSVDHGLQTFLTKGAGPWGAGDILMAFLGPVILSFGFRIYSQRALMRRHFVEIFGTVLLSSLFSLFATAAVASAAGLPPPLARALVPRSVTVALALPMAAQLGAPAPLTAAAVCVTGLIGANFCRALLDAFGFRDPITRGLATAGSAHGLGTAALAAKEPEALPFCALAYALMGIVSNVLVSLPFVRAALISITG